jgi:hypothetical protein
MKTDKSRQSWRRNITTPLATSIVTAVLANQQDFFFLFVLVKQADTSLCMITTLGINLRRGLCRYIIRNRSRRACTLVQARQSLKSPLFPFFLDRRSQAAHLVGTL